MPSELSDNQYELMLPDESLSVVFGTEETGVIGTTYPLLETGDGVTGDVQRVREDGVAFGEDYLSGKTYTFELAVLSDRNHPTPHNQVTDRLNDLEGVWLDERFRNRSQGYGVLRVQMAGRLTRCYGRPRRYSEVAGRLTHKGMTPVIADFIISDGRFYDDAESTLDMNLVPAMAGGLRTPITFPWGAANDTEGDDALVVGGKKPTWVTVEFYGPVTNPSVQIGPLKVALQTTIPYGRKVTVDARPWSRSVLRDDGANQAGKLTWDTPPLRRLLLPTGTHHVVYRGVDATGTSYCRVKWRNARSRP